MDVNRFAGVEVEDPDARPVDLAARLRGQATVLVFIRHYG